MRHYKVKRSMMYIQYLQGTLHIISIQTLGMCKNTFDKKSMVLLSFILAATFLIKIRDEIKHLPRCFISSPIATNTRQNFDYFADAAV